MSCIVIFFHLVGIICFFGFIHANSGFIFVIFIVGVLIPNLDNIVAAQEHSTQNCQRNQQHRAVRAAIGTIIHNFTTVIFSGLRFRCGCNGFLCKNIRNCTGICTFRILGFCDELHQIVLVNHGQQIHIAAGSFLVDDDVEGIIVLRLDGIEILVLIGLCFIQNGGVAIRSKGIGLCCFGFHCSFFCSFGNARIGIGKCGGSQTAHGNQAHCQSQQTTSGSFGFTHILVPHFRYG